MYGFCVWLPLQGQPFLLFPLALRQMKKVTYCYLFTFLYLAIQLVLSL